MSWMDKKDSLQAELREIDPGVVLMSKDAPFWRMMGWLAAPFTGRAGFRNDFATSIGTLQGYPTAWGENTVRKVGVHEIRHTRQQRICGWFIPVLGWLPWIAPWVGLPLFFLIWGLLPFPIFFAWGRYRLELDATAASWKNELQHGTSVVYVQARVKGWAGTISSRAYGWSIPRRWAEWGAVRKFNQLVRQISSGS